MTHSMRRISRRSFSARCASRGHWDWCRRALKGITSVKSVNRRWSIARFVTIASRGQGITLPRVSAPSWTIFWWVGRTRLFRSGARHLKFQFLKHLHSQHLDSKRFFIHKCHIFTYKLKWKKSSFEKNHLQNMSPMIYLRCAANVKFIFWKLFIH